MKKADTWKDPIVEEVRRVREAHAEKFGHDLRAIVQDLKRHEADREVVSLPPKPAVKEKGAA